MEPPTDAGGRTPLIPMSAFVGVHRRLIFSNPQSAIRTSPGVTLVPVWSFPIGQTCAVGITPVQDTLVWISSGGVGFPADSNWMLVYDLRSRALVDSFPEPTSTTWGYRDLAYDSRSDVVYAGDDNDRLDRIDATTHELISSVRVSGESTPGVVRGMGFDGDSLYSSDFYHSAICKFATDGTNCHMVGTIPSSSVYGLAIDRRHGRLYASTQDDPGTGTLLIYGFPGFDFCDSIALPEVPGGEMDGCETWRNDSFLLVVGQTEPRTVFCYEIRAGAGIAEPSPPGVGVLLGANGHSPRLDVWPNPARDGLRVAFTLPRTARVSAAVFDVKGVAVRALGSGMVGAGRHAFVWDRRDMAGRRVASGTYFLQVRADGMTVNAQALVVGN